MDLEKVAIELSEIAKDGAVFICTNYPLTDFTRPFQGTLQIHGKKKALYIDLSNINELNTIAYLLNALLDEQLLIITWDIKELMSYFKFNVSAKPTFNSKFFDLKYMESYLGIHQSVPVSLKESLRRLQQVQNDKLKIIHKRIHLPLAINVLPSLETQGMLHTEMKKRVYWCYRIEGQVNGRLLCEQNFSNCIIPHCLTNNDKKGLKLSKEDEVFVVFDFKCMEVMVLEYLSKDKKLTEIIAKGGDLYQNIWTVLFNKPCEKLEHRKFIKESFLPVIYGRQAESLAKEVGCSLEAANSFIYNMRKNFSEAFNYVESYQSLLKTSNKAEDFFGRVRVFDEKLWGVRNFVIQSPASIVCLEKLIDLYNIVGKNLIFSIHDGYIIRANIKFDKPLIIKCIKSLETQSQLMPGLQLKVNCEIGFCLNNLKSFKGA
jgi:DNA polymerase I-like protein with 3'-5' exonuclease and polymerase domains